MLVRHRKVALIVLLILGLVMWFVPSSKWQSAYPLRPSKDLAVSNKGPSADQILNSTLGFQHIYTINLPSRTDRRDAMTLAAALSGLSITWIDGVAGKDVSAKVLPGGGLAADLPTGNKGSWRAHMNALQRIIQENVTTALILEDDADWDIRLKAQLQVFARAALPFTQPVASAGNLPLSELYRKDSASPLPSAPAATFSPYGSTWDVLWLGHCGTSFPPSSPSPQQPPPLIVTIADDPTVPAPSHLKPHPFALRDVLADKYPPHTRVVHASSGTICTQAYAVTQQGARRLLWRFGLAEEKMGKGWDLLLGDWCDGLYLNDDRGHVGGEGHGVSEEQAANREKQQHKPVCVTVQPPLFSHHFRKGGSSDIMALGGGFVRAEKSMTPYVRLSVRLNMERLVDGMEPVDQWEEEVAEKVSD
ncbi:hypothetical protein VTK26DRAFT_3058 [Humicola hyalothermophila]